MAQEQCLLEQAGSRRHYWRGSTKRKREGEAYHLLEQVQVRGHCSGNASTKPQSPLSALDDYESVDAAIES